MTGVQQGEDFLEFNLALFATRRDVALLGLVHRAVLGRGPVLFREYFKLDPNRSSTRHPRQLVQYDHDVTDFLYPGSCPAAYVQRSVLGIVRIYNKLPAHIVACSPVSDFQSSLQRLLCDAASHDYMMWRHMLSVRIQSWEHPLRDF